MNHIVIIVIIVFNDGWKLNVAWRRDVTLRRTSTSPASWRPQRSWGSSCWGTGGSSGSGGPPWSSPRPRHSAAWWTWGPGPRTSCPPSTPRCCRSEGRRCWSFPPRTGSPSGPPAGCWWSCWGSRGPRGPRGPGWSCHQSLNAPEGHWGQKPGLDPPSLGLLLTCQRIQALGLQALGLQVLSLLWTGQRWGGLGLWCSRGSLEWSPQTGFCRRTRRTTTIVCKMKNGGKWTKTCGSEEGHWDLLETWSWRDRRISLFICLIFFFFWFCLHFFVSKKYNTFYFANFFF